MRKSWAVTAIIIIAVLSLSLTFIFLGCGDKSEPNISGAWYLTDLQDFKTGSQYDFSPEMLVLHEDGTGIEVYLPCDINEEYSYIAWSLDPSDSSLHIKHSSDYSYELDIVESSSSELKCTFYFDDAPDNYYLATYKKMDEGSYSYVGRWTLFEYTENGENYDTGSSDFYFYPDKSFIQTYLELEEEIQKRGTWEIAQGNLKLNWDSGESKSLENNIAINKLELYDTSEMGNSVISVYKRYYGLITNSPPAGYSQHEGNKIGSVFCSVFGKDN